MRHDKKDTTKSKTLNLYVAALISACVCRGVCIVSEENVTGWHIRNGAIVDDE